MPQNDGCFNMILSDYDCELPAEYEERKFFLPGTEMRVYSWIPYCKCNAQVYTLYTLWMEKTMDMISCGIARCVIACIPCMDTEFEMIEVKGDGKWASLWLWLC